MTTNIISNQTLKFLNISKTKQLFFQLSAEELTHHAIENNEGVLADSGGLACKTGKFTGRSPKDRYIVLDQNTKNTVDWGKVNIAFDESKFDTLHQKMCHFLEDQKVYVRYAIAGADPNQRLNICVLTTSAWQNLFCHNMFIRPTEEELENFVPDFTILAVPEFMANPEIDGTAKENFTILNTTKKVILIGGTGYAGEIKKGVFSALNFLLPQKGILPMHCSANIGKSGDVALFFGLSGTGKTTLSADPDRSLIGDDEHGWTNDSVYNFEGGCYAKAINLSKENEPQIYGAIREGSIIENTTFREGTNEVDFSDSSITENTRVSYPIHYITNAVEPSIGNIPKNIFFLTCDAFGVLPPISKLSTQQAIDYFKLGYTAKVAGTEMGVVEPQATFSACFGAAFMPLPVETYAELLGEKIVNNDVNVWLINTGWTGGGYGVGERIKLKYTRAMIREVLEGDLAICKFQKHPIFGLMMPVYCHNVPTELLNPRQTWQGTDAYDTKANELLSLFNERIN